MDGYGSHIPILEAIAAQSSPWNSVLEFGMGKYSTPWLLSHSGRLVSVETDATWYDTCKHPNSVLMDATSVIDWTWQLHAGEYDLVFIDCHPYSLRMPLANIILDARVTQVLALHDSEEALYEYDKIAVPVGWTYTDVVMYRPWTGVVTNKNLRYSPMPHLTVQDMTGKTVLR